MPISNRQTERIHNQYKIQRTKKKLFIDTFNNISFISWLSVLLVDETGEPVENHRPVASYWQTVGSVWSVYGEAL
jgi:hypothetical protein